MTTPPPRRPGIPLQDRGSRPGPAPGAPEARDTQLAGVTHSPGRRHCWVEHPELGTLEGMVLHWLVEDGRWRALVVYVDPNGAAITTWVPAEALTPVTGQAP